MDGLSIDVTGDPRPGDLDAVAAGLSAFNDADAGAADHAPLAVLVRDTSGTVVAGISGHTAWGWLYVRWLWVAEAQRGRRLAGAMLEAAEREACARGCHGSHIDTFNPVALQVYRRAGYSPFGALEAFPKGRTRVFLRKAL